MSTTRARQRGSANSLSHGSPGFAAPTNASANRLLGYLGLFSSAGTLLCCALPSLLVLLGFGATVASTLSAVPWMVSLSRQKEWLFAVSGLLIALNLYYVYALAPRLLVASGVCPADDPQACARATRTSRVLLWVSATLFLVGFAVAYLLPSILTRLDG